MKKEPSFLLSPTLGIIKVFSNNYPVYFLFLLCYNDQDERQKYGVIEVSNKKAERSYSPGNVPRVYSCFNPDTEIVIIKNNTNSELSSVFVLFPCGGALVT